MDHECEWLFYLRDTPHALNPRKSGKPAQTKANGRPVVCIAADRSTAPETHSLTDEEVGKVAFWLHFCIATCCPTDLNPQASENGTVFSKALGRVKATGRLKARRTIDERTVPSFWAASGKVFKSQVGLTIPIYDPNPGRQQIERAIVCCIADPSYRFATTARQLAEEWLARDSAG